MKVDRRTDGHADRVGKERQQDGLAAHTHEHGVRRHVRRSERLGSVKGLLDLVVGPLANQARPRDGRPRALDDDLLGHPRMERQSILYVPVFGKENVALPGTPELWTPLSSTTVSPTGPKTSGL